MNLRFLPAANRWMVVQSLGGWSWAASGLECACAWLAWRGFFSPSESSSKVNNGGERINFDFSTFSCNYLRVSPVSCAVVSSYNKLESLPWTMSRERACGWPLGHWSDWPLRTVCSPRCLQWTPCPTGASCTLLTPTVPSFFTAVSFPLGSDLWTPQGLGGCHSFMFGSRWGVKKILVPLWPHYLLTTSHLTFLNLRCCLWKIRIAIMATSQGWHKNECTKGFNIELGTVWAIHITVNLLQIFYK